ncbi:unnamed protein product [Ixodes persulcatus]
MSLLPPFPAFIVHANQSTVRTRWKKWVTRFRNFFVACNITVPGRSKAMLLHYAGEDVNDIFESLCDTTVAAAPSTSSSPSTTTASTPAAAANEFERAIEALTFHFQPRCNVEHERFLFRRERQLENESVATYHTRLREIARRCRFSDINGEIKSQIIQTCTPSSLRRKALQLLDYAHSSELADLHAKDIEKDLVSSSVALYAKDTAPRTKSHKQKSFNTNAVCGHCGGPYPHPTTQRCPSRGSTTPPSNSLRPRLRTVVMGLYQPSSTLFLRWTPLDSQHFSVIPAANLEPIRMPHLGVWLKTTITFGWQVPCEATTQGSHVRYNCPRHH